MKKIILKMDPQKYVFGLLSCAFWNVPHLEPQASYALTAVPSCLDLFSLEPDFAGHVWYKELMNW